MFEKALVFLLTVGKKRGIIIKLSKRAVHIETRRKLIKIPLKELKKFLTKQSKTRYNNRVAHESGA